MPLIVKKFPITRSFERTGGQSTFLHQLGGTRNLGNGVYQINPVEASYAKESPLVLLARQAKDLGHRATMAEERGNEVAKRRYGMLESALEDAVMAGSKHSPNEEMRLLLQLGSNGSPVGGASYQKGDVYGLGAKDLMDLDFTGSEPGTLHSLGVLGATEPGKTFLTGTQLIQKAQDALGSDHMYLQTIDQPKYSNIEYYYNLGARPTGRRQLGGNPFYEFKSRAAREPEPENPDQLRLPGFAEGGALSKLFIEQVSRATGKPPTDAQIRAADQGYNTVMTRFGGHRRALNVRNDKEGVGIHADLVPGGPAAIIRSTTEEAPTSHTVDLLAGRLGKLGRATDDEANDLLRWAQSPRGRSAGISPDDLAKIRDAFENPDVGVRNWLIDQGYSGLVYPNNAEAAESILDAQQGFMRFGLKDPVLNHPTYNSTGDVMFNPSVVLMKPEELRLLEEAKFDPRYLGQAGLRKAKGGLVQYKECTCGK